MKYLIPVEKLIDAGSHLFGVLPEVIAGPSRKQVAFRPRAAVVLAARCAGYSYPKIARAFDRGDHTWSIRACDRAEQFYKENPKFKRHCDMLIGLARKFQEANNDNEATPEIGCAVNDNGAAVSQ